MIERRLRPVGDGHVQRRVGRFQVLLHQERGDVQRLAAVVEAVRRRVRGQQLLQVDVDAEQVADGVLVLDPVEPAQDRAALCAPGGPGLRLDPAGERLNVLLRRPRLRLRRHLARLHPLQHREPALPVRRVGEVGREPVQAEVALRLLAGVALLAVLGQERAERIVGLLGRRRWWLGPAASVGQRQEGESSAKRRAFMEPNSQVGGEGPGGG